MQDTSQVKFIKVTAKVHEEKIIAFCVQIQLYQTPREGKASSTPSLNLRYFTSRSKVR